MTPANPHILTVNGGSSSIKFALFEAADSLDIFAEYRGNTLGRTSSLPPEFSVRRHTSFSKNERYKAADEVDGGSMKRAVKITPMLLGMDGMQLRSVSAKTVLHLFRNQGRIVA